MLISKISPNVNNYYTNNNTGKNLTFTSTPGESKLFKPVNDLYDRFTTSLAHGIGKILDTETAYKVIERTKNCNNLLTHLIVIGSTILSGFYIKKTLDNDKLEEHKKKTLAINQGIVWGLSTVMAYTLDGIANKKMIDFSEKFKNINLKNTEISSELMNKYIEGIKTAKTMIIAGVVYRYLAPVIVTPIANKIGNKLHEKNKAKKA
ncbi:MAG: hypothetical protein PHC64_08455 [Candidatus Gastranaerophilales bacterium]|nr:hypothetical protein [Candidatus Gastranaerophilales bacterium]